MGKKSHRRSPSPGPPGKNSGSCLWGFTSLLDFSQNHNPHRLLADRKLGSARYYGMSHYGTELPNNPFESKHNPDANVGDVCRAAKVKSPLLTVKALIAKEMSKEKASNSSGSKRNKDRKVNKNHKAEWNFQRNTIEGSNLIVDLAALMMEFYCISSHFPELHANLEDDFSHSTLSEYDSVKLHEALSVEAEVFLVRKINDAKQLIRNGIILSEEFMDALEILNSNKELFLKLILGPNSFVFRHIKELKGEHSPGPCSEENEQLFEKRDTSQTNKSSSNQTLYHMQKQGFFSKKDKSREKNPSEATCSTKEMKRIVLLKPFSLTNHDVPATTGLSPQSHNLKKRYKDTEGVLPPFSFKEIKNKLRYIINNSRKEQHGDLQRIQHADEALDYQDGNYNVGNTGVRKTDKKREMKECHEGVEAETSHENRAGITSFPLISKESFFYQEVKKHLPEMLGDEYATDNPDCRRFSPPIFTKEILSLINYNLNSPRPCPHGEEEVQLSTSPTNTSPMLQLMNEYPTYLSPRNQNLEEISCSRSNSDVENRRVNVPEMNMDANLQEDTTTMEQAKTEGSDEILKIEREKRMHTNVADYCNTNVTGKSEGSANSSCEICNEEGCCTPSESVAPDKKSRILTTSAFPASLIINQFESSASIIVKPDRPSPVSVLEPIFLEDNASPDHAGNEMQ
ncbi:hypothetical protein AXF42_Ash018956 [Apostasia shenzhenica]|uniref:DUF3741 domain-containing protein n=1 Tax=Apostasia shenzhenica TaxID=1088818 RepID=A0A2I0B4M3_9ASPA|nr:hypothetical protein AXF42_Ash018956 [Apostasia shenzhenica]